MNSCPWNYGELFILKDIVLTQNINQKKKIESSNFFLLIFVLLFEAGSQYVAKDGLELKIFTP